VFGARDLKQKWNEFVSPHFDSRGICQVPSSVHTKTLKPDHSWRSLRSGSD
jgi:hypothetical protein